MLNRQGSERHRKLDFAVRWQSLTESVCRDFSFIKIISRFFKGRACVCECVLNTCIQSYNIGLSYMIDWERLLFSVL